MNTMVEVYTDLTGGTPDSLYNPKHQTLTLTLTLTRNPSRPIRMDPKRPVATLADAQTLNGLS